MPKLLHRERINQNLIIGVQEYAESKNEKYSGGMWTARIQIAGKTIVKSTKIPYDNGGKFSKDKAREAALNEWIKARDAIERGIDPRKIQKASKLHTEYQEEVAEMVAANERRTNKGDTPIYEVLGGRGYWNSRRYADFLPRAKVCHKFLQSIKSKRAGNKNNSKSIEELGKRDLDSFDSWMRKNYPQHSIETRLKNITEMRHFLHWCYHKQYIENVPSIKRPSKGGIQGMRSRMRKEITPEQYLKIINYTREKYTDKNADIALVFRDYQYLFHLWILILANTGIRPPTSDNLSNKMKWGHFDLGDKPTLYREEKGHVYKAVVMPGAKRFVEELKKFYEEQRGMKCGKDDFVFRHTVTIRDESGIRWKQGDPIKSFKGQWDKMRKDEIWKGELDGITPSSLRAFFITQRLYADEGRIDILKLAQACGTSVGQIEIRYARLETGRSYDFLTAGAYLAEGKEPKYITIDGTQYYAGRE